MRVLVEAADVDEPVAEGERRSDQPAEKRT